MVDVPQYTRQTGIGSAPIVQLSTAGARVQQQASVELGAIAQDMQQKSEKLERLRAQATMREEMHRMSREIGANPAALQQNMDKYRGKFVAGLPSGMRDEFNEIYRMESLSHIDAAYNKYNQNLREDMKMTGMRNFTAATNNLQLYTKMMNEAQTPEQREAAANGFRSTIASLDEIQNLGDNEGSIFSPAERLAMASEAVASPIKAMTPEQQMLALNPPMGFEENMGLIWKHEVDPRDPNKIHSDGNGTIAKFGINSGANPEVDFNTLTADQAKEIYRNKYWNAAGLDNVAPEYQGVIFDAAVNQGVDFAKKLAKEAAGGASPSAIIEMRRERYNKTSGTPQEKLSWERRLSTFTPIAMGENKDMLDPDMKDRMIKGVQDSMQREEKLKMEDFGAWAANQGMDVPTRVAAQSGRPFVQVMPNQQAKQIVEQLKNFQKPDDFINFAQGLKQQYVGGERYAVQNLVQNGLEPEMEMALQMANTDPVGYNEQISSLFAYKALGKEADNGLRARGTKATDIEDAVGSAFLSSDVSEMMQYQYGQTSVMARSRALSSLQAMAKGYMLRNPNASQDDAVKFVLQPMEDEYQVARVNGLHFQVPKLDSADDLERRMREFYKKTFEPMKNKGLALNPDKVVPVLNEDENTYRFVDIMGEPVMVNGEPLSVGIQELKDRYTPPEQIPDIRMKREQSIIPVESTIPKAVFKRGK